MRTGLVHYFTKYFQLASRSLQDVLESLTSDKDLQAVLAYAFGDYGVAPNEVPFTMHACLISHFIRGVAYPRGGSSEFAFNIIPTIERGGGRVLVRGAVKSIVVENGVAVGVRMERDDNEIRAPIIISDAGMFNTYETLLPAQARQPAMTRMLSTVRHGVACMSVYVGLDGSDKDLGLQPTNSWFFPEGPQQSDAWHRYLTQDASTVLDAPIPLLFISFPSTKDPTYQQRFPGKSTVSWCN